MHAMVEDVVEASHNGIVAWEQMNHKFFQYYYKVMHDNIKTKERWNVLKIYFDTNQNRIQRNIFDQR